MLRPRLLPQAVNFSRNFRRGLRTLPLLQHDVSNGIGSLFSPAAVDIAWFQYQSLMIDKLNMLTAGTKHENTDVKTTALEYARDPNSAPIFNYASMAHNNHFFFKTLSPVPVSMPEQLKTELERSFGSIDTLKRELIVTASSMFGPGFVWLVKNRSNKYSLMSTYLAGSPYPAAHYRRQPLDMNTEDKSVSEALARKYREAPVNTVGSHGVFSQKHDLAPGGIDIAPLLCINMWEHVFMVDYGLGYFSGGKKAFAEAWWDAIDWSVVAANADADVARQFVGGSRQRL